MHYFAGHSSWQNKLFYPVIFLILFNATTTNQISDSSDDPHGGPEIENSNRRKLLSYNGDILAINPSLAFENFRLKNAYIALQAWKEAILSDPYNITENWIGSNVCNYTGVFCWPSIDEASELTVAGIDINHGDIAGKLPHELGLLYDIALFHINSNRFCGTIPSSFLNLKLLFELDVSNNRFVGKFPDVVVQLPNLRFLDLRFNEFEGELPSQVFERNFDALFINNNRFSSELPDNFGNSPVSESIGELVSLEQLNLGHNMLSGKISSNICTLPNLKNFVYDNNYFSEESPACLNLQAFADQQNCLRGRPGQRSALDCQRFLSNEVDCSTYKCALPPPSPTPPNTCCTCSPPPPAPPLPPLPSPLPPIESPSSPLPSPLSPPIYFPPPPPCFTTPPSISPPSPSPTQNSSSPPAPNLPSAPPSFVEPPLPSPPCANQKISPSQAMSPLSP